MLLSQPHFLCSSYTNTSCLVTTHDDVNILYVELLYSSSSWTTSTHNNTNNLTDQRLPPRCRRHGMWPSDIREQRTGSGTTIRDLHVSGIAVRRDSHGKDGRTDRWTSSNAYWGRLKDCCSIVYRSGLLNTELDGKVVRLYLVHSI